jgi:hypothetical protein
VCEEKGALSKGDRDPIDEDEDEDEDEEGEDEG